MPLIREIFYCVNYFGFRIGFAELAYGSVVDFGFQIRIRRSAIRNSLGPVNITWIAFYNSLEFHLQQLG